MSDNYVDQGSNTRIAGWHKVSDPATGWLASKTSGWVADRFSDTPTDCLTVDFSSVVPVGTKAVRCPITFVSGGSNDVLYYRRAGDTNISNTPGASSEFSHRLLWCGVNSIGQTQAVLWLSADYKVDFALTVTTSDVYIAYPVEYLL